MNVHFPKNKFPDYLVSCRLKLLQRGEETNPDKLEKPVDMHRNCHEQDKVSDKKPNPKLYLIPIHYSNYTERMALTDPLMVISMHEVNDSN